MLLLSLIAFEAGPVTSYLPLTKCQKLAHSMHRQGTPLAEGRGYMLTKTNLIAAALLAVLSVPAAAAETLCGSRDAVMKQLATEYQESPVGLGLASNGAVVELLTSSKGSWTLIVTPPSGPTCLMGTGEAWQPVARKLMVKESES